MKRNGRQKVRWPTYLVYLVLARAEPGGTPKEFPAKYYGLTFLKGEFYGIGLFNVIVSPSDTLKKAADSRKVLPPSSVLTDAHLSFTFRNSHYFFTKTVGGYADGYFFMFAYCGV